MHKHKQKKQPAFSTGCFLQFLTDFSLANHRMPVGSIVRRPPPVTAIFAVNLPHNPLLKHNICLQSRKIFIFWHHPLNDTCTLDAKGPLDSRSRYR